MPEKITASYRIVTPMFIGDAKQKARAISPTSVKGALRFWWRVRRGFGSIALEQLDRIDMGFASADDYVKATKDLLTTYDINEAEPPYTAFSSLVARKEDRG